MEDTGNIVQMKHRSSLFSPDLRQKLIEDIGLHTDNAEEVVRAVENTLCNHLVSTAADTAGQWVTSATRSLWQLFCK